MSKIAIMLLAAAASSAMALPAHAACSDRPGTPVDTRVEPAAGMETNTLRFTWRDTLRADERAWHDIEVTDSAGRVVQSLTGVGIGAMLGSRQFSNRDFGGLQPGTHRCFRIRARTAAGTQGCVSKLWSGKVCGTTSGGPLHSGPDTCKSGFVWREATAGDHVCVPPTTRDETKRENALAASRRQGSGAFGPDTCKSGFVWREAVAGDRVCVPTARRSQARRDNALAAQRRVRG